MLARPAQASLTAGESPYCCRRPAFGECGWRRAGTLKRIISHSQKSLAALCKVSSHPVVLSWLLLLLPVSRPFEASEPLLFHQQQRETNTNTLTLTANKRASSLLVKTSIRPICVAVAERASGEREREETGNKLSRSRRSTRLIRSICCCSRLVVKFLSADAGGLAATPAAARSRPSANVVGRPVFVVVAGVWRA
jgi:hypothetical protein